ncbi:MAG: ribosome biogenesis GTP-binding protein YihA/YsxC [Azovibrio sp.]|uniref:ribosome biogenesis GTP-binding protein YihA/YsxC n=1 Tax=Azovibrio sp. TaxID=1872673 RepID=UPI003C72D1E8
MPLLQQATFLTTVAHLRDLPEDSVAEVAFVGRSNAGKSSAINTLAGRVRLAYVSKTPGRTQHLNYFTVQPGKYLVDLPGYGFAKTPAAIRGQWEGLLGPYLQQRSPLAGLVMIMDIRHPMTDLDRRMMDWYLPTGRPIHVLLSKADKLSRQEQTKVLRQVKQALAELSERCSVQLFSSLKKTGVEECEDVLGAWLDIPVPPRKKPPVKGGPGAKCLDIVAAPAQGGEAGDGANRRPPDESDAASRSS